MAIDRGLRIILFIVVFMVIYTVSKPLILGILSALGVVTLLSIIRERRVRG